MTEGSDAGHAAAIRVGAPAGDARMGRPEPDVRRARYYLGETFVVEHSCARSVRSTAVVLLPPLGYEDSCAYRPLRVLADAIAAAGFVVVRVDWPGLGDSGGDPLDPDLPERWLHAARAAADGLRSRGAVAVVGLGVRAGGLIAAASGAFDHLVLWGSPPNGRRYLREERAFHKLAAERFSEPPAGVPGAPPGSVEAGGFLHGPAVVGWLDALDPATFRPVQRVLLLGRDGSDPPSALVDGFVAAGAQVDAERLPGLSELLENPYHSGLRSEVRARIVAWLVSLPGPAAVLGPHRGAETLALDGLVERPWSGAGGAGVVSGVVCLPAGGAPGGAPWTVFFNAGGIRRCGPNRLWTVAARALARRGRPSLRLDVRDVGDSDGSNVPHRDLEAMYAPDSIADATLAWDAVSAWGAGAVDVVGLCSGAFLSAQVAARRAVRRATLFNGIVLVWDDEARANAMTDQIGGSLLDRRRWQRLLEGRIDARQLSRSILSKARISVGNAARRAVGRPVPSPVRRLVRDLRARGTELRFVSSAGDPSVAYLQRHLPDDERPPLVVLPGVDHTIRPVWAHEQVLSLILTP